MNLMVNAIGFFISSKQVIFHYYSEVILQCLNININPFLLKQGCLILIIRLKSLILIMILINKLKSQKNHDFNQNYILIKIIAFIV